MKGGTADGETLLIEVKVTVEGRRSNRGKKKRGELKERREVSPAITRLLRVSQHALSVIQSKAASVILPNIRFQC